MSVVIGAEVSMTSAMSSTAQQGAAAYDLLLHSLTHEHTKNYYDRHLLLFEKWCRDYSEGFFIRDLPYIMSLFGVLRDRLETHPSLFRGVLSSVLKICSLPLFEAKANERLRSKSIEMIKDYMKEITLFWVHGDSRRNTEIAKCFRCIVNGGLDPCILKADIVKWTSDGLRVQVAERVYLQTLLRESKTVDVLVDCFLSSASFFEQEYESKNSKSTTSLSPNMSRNPSKVMGDTQQQQAAAEAATRRGTSIDDDSDDEMVVGRAALSSTLNEDEQPASKSSGGGADAAKASVAEALELTQVMLSLCQELTEDNKTSAEMCARRLCDGCIKLLRIAALQSPRDIGVTNSVDLMWTILDSYLGQCNVMAGSNGHTAAPLSELVALEVMNYETAISVLLKVLLQLLHDGYRLADKECRNEILVVMSLIATFPASLPSFMSSTALNTLVTYSCIAEMGVKAWPFYTKPYAKFRNFASIADVDLQLKRTLWMATSDVLKGNDPDPILCVASSPMVDNMLAYLEFDSSEPHKHHHDAGGAGGGGAAGEGSIVHQSVSSPVREGSSVQFARVSSVSRAEPEASTTTAATEGGFPPSDMEGVAAAAVAGAGDGAGVTATDQLAAMADLGSTSGSSSSAFLKTLPLTQLRELQVLAMSFLAENGPKMVGELLRVNGPVRILDVTYKYCRSSISEHKQLVYASLLFLNRCMLCSDYVKKLMEQENAIQTFLYLFEHTDEEPAKALAARLISILCAESNVVCQQQVRSQNGIVLLTQVIAKYADFRKIQVGRKAGIKFHVKGEDGSLEDPNADALGGDVGLLVVAVLDSVSKAVVGNRKSEAMLAKKEGVDALLNLLEVSPFILRAQVLRLLSDLLENNTLLTFLHAWRSPKSMRPATQIFTHCWLDEEVRLDASREKGVLCNIYEPLGTHKWPIDTITQHDGESLSSVGSSKSIAVARLADAISISRSAHGVVPTKIRLQVLDKDMRGILSRILLLIGMLDAYVSTLPNGGQSSPLNSPQQQQQQQQQQHGVSFSETNDVDVAQEVAEGSSSAVPPLRLNTNNGERQQQQQMLPIPPASPSPSNYDNESKSGTGGMPTIVVSSDAYIVPADRQVFALANQYQVLREGEWWRAVSDELQSEGITPIEADLSLMEARIGGSFEAAFKVQLEQMEQHQVQTKCNQSRRNKLSIHSQAHHLHLSLYHFFSLS